MHILQVFLLKRCWENTELMWITLFLVDNATLVELSELKKNKTFLERVYSFAASSVKRLTSDVAERDRQILALQQEIRALQNQPGLPLASRWFYCQMPFHFYCRGYTRYQFNVFVWIYWFAVSTTSSYCNFRIIIIYTSNNKYKQIDKAIWNVQRIIKLFRNIRKEQISIFFIVHDSTRTPTPPI